MPFLKSALLCLLVASAGVFAEKESTVIVISMDGVRHDISENMIWMHLREWRKME